MRHEFQPRPIHSPDSSQFYLFVALGHYWGGASGVAKLTSVNIYHLLLGMDISILSSKFQDAIKITKGLGAQYLWIDALCIVQHSKEDWANEAVMMGQYCGAALDTTSCFSSPAADYGYSMIAKWVSLAALDLRMGIYSICKCH